MWSDPAGGDPRVEAGIERPDGFSSFASARHATHAAALASSPFSVLASSSLWPPIQQGALLLQHEMGGRSGNGASRLPSARSSPTPASEMGDLGCVSVGGHEGDGCWPFFVLTINTSAYIASCRPMASSELATGPNPSHGGYPWLRLSALLQQSAS